MIVIGSVGVLPRLPPEIAVPGTWVICWRMLAPATSWPKMVKLPSSDRGEPVVTKNWESCVACGVVTFGLFALARANWPVPLKTSWGEVSLA